MKNWLPCKLITERTSSSIQTNDMQETIQKTVYHRIEILVTITVLLVRGFCLLFTGTNPKILNLITKRTSICGGFNIRCLCVCLSLSLSLSLSPSPSPSLRLIHHLVSHIMKAEKEVLFLVVRPLRRGGVRARPLRKK